MGLEKVIQEIKAQAEQEKKTLLRETETTVQGILNESKNKAANLKQETQKKTSTLVQDLKNKELSKYRLEEKKQIMEAKNQIFQEIFSNALQSAEKMSETERKQVLKKLLERGLKELPNSKYFYSSKKDAKIIEQLSGKLKFAGEIDCVGGLVLENEEKNTKVNYTFEVLFEKTKEDCLHEISATAF